MAYDDGEVRRQFSICFHARIVGGQIRTSTESKEVAFVPPAGWMGWTSPLMLLRIDHGLAERIEPYIG